MLSSDSATVNRNSFVLSLAVVLTTVFDTFRPPVSLVFVNSANPAVSDILPVSPAQVVTKSDSSVSITLYVMPFAKPVAALLSPSFSVNSATPFINDISPYVPLTVSSSNLTVKLKSFVLSASMSLSTLLLTTRPPSSFLFVNAAVDFSVLIVPVSPVLVVIKPAAVSSSTI